jgi:putative membrane protein
MILLAAAHPLVHVNATLNAVAAVLLVVGLVMIKQGRVLAHKRVMLTAFGVSVVFLVCYLWYHYLAGSVKFTHPGAIRYVYYFILLTHVLLAATVPVLAIWTIYLGLRATGSFGRGDTHVTGEDLAVYRAKHRRLARWTYPIWLYVSVTGVVVYVMLYHLWPPADL